MLEKYLALNKKSPNRENKISWLQTIIRKKGLPEIIRNLKALCPEFIIRCKRVKIVIFYQFRVHPAIPEQYWGMN